LIFVTKGFKGYHIMKEIMARESTSTIQGVPTYTFNTNELNQPRLFDATRPLDRLIEILPIHFHAQTLTMQQIYERHSVGTQYTEKNYKEALLALEARGDIIVDAGGKRRPRNTFANHLKVTFP
jgi:hypothetical protein